MGANQEAVDKNDIRAILGKTKGGKEIYLVREPNCSVRKIKLSGGGVVPEGLQGGFSAVHYAQDAVDIYLASDTVVKKEPVVTKNTKPKGRAAVKK